jgi:hypothetical protein
MYMRSSTRFIVFVAAVTLVLLTAACGGASTGTGSPTTASGSGAAAGNPADAAKGFLTAVFTGGDVNSYLCTTNAAAAKALNDGMTAMKNGLAASGAKIDVSGLTFDAGTVTGDTATVKVSGSLKVTVSGVDQSVPYSGAAIPVKNESGTWKVCG